MANAGRPPILWDADELAALRDIYPRAAWPEVLAALPRHPRRGIYQMARGLGLRRQINSRTPWVAAEISTLYRLYETADQAELEAALPSRPFSCIMKMAAKYKLRRKKPATRRNRRFVHPIIRRLREEREQQRMTRKRLSEILGYHANQLLGWELGKTNPDIRFLQDWAEALGLEFVLREKKASNVVIPWPGLKRLMAGR